jgi:Tol biopolymer transport system component
VGASTVTDKLTRTGEVVGTVTSMSPEQVEGREVDHRSDIFSLGVLLYEMLSGRHPFTGETHAAVMNAIVNADAPDLPANVPEAIAGVVRRCLEKLPERRFQSAADLGYALRTAVPAQPRGEAQRKRKRWPVAAVAIAAIALGAAGMAHWWLRPGMPSADLVSVPLVAWPGGAYMPTFSPDGNRVAFNWEGEKGDKPHIYIEQIGSGTRPVQLTNGPAEFYPAWSPDDKYIAFFRNVGSGNALMLVPAIGGPERKVVDFPDFAGMEAWSPDSKWLAMAVTSRQNPMSIWLVSVSTGERRRLTTPAATNRGDVWPSISPDGRSIAFEREVTSYAFAPYVLKLSRDYRPEGPPRELTTMRYSDVWGTVWTADGREVVFSAGPLGNETLLRVPASGRSQIYVMQADGGGKRRMTNDSADDVTPSWSHDGRWIYFASDRSGRMETWKIPPRTERLLKPIVAGSRHP